jgi:hypothetical protein
VRVVFWLLTVVVTAVVTAFVVVHVVRFDGGPLDRGVGNGVGGPWPADVALGLGMLELHNSSGHPVTIQRIRLGPHTPGIRYLGALIARPHCPGAVTLAAYPPRSDACHYVSADELTVPPHATIDGYVGVEAPTGKYRVHGVVVDYMRRLAPGVTLKMRARVGPLWSMCMTSHWPRRLCKPPSLGTGA